VFLSSNRRRIAAAVGLTAATAAVGLPLLFSPPAGADTAGNPLTTTLSIGSQTNVAPGTPLTGITNGETATITATTTAAPAGQVLNGIDVRLCAGASTVTSSFDFSPLQGGKCIKDPVGASDTLKSLAVGPPNVTGTTTFNLGKGSDTFSSAAFPGGNTITCNSTHPCTLWINEKGTFPLTTSGTASNLYVSYPVNYAAPVAPVAPTAATATLAGPNLTNANLAWTAPANADEVDFYTITPVVNGTAGTPFNTPDATPSFTVTGLNYFSSYVFQIAAHNPTATGPTVATAAVSPNPTVTPTGVSAVSPGSGLADVTWTNPTDTSGVTAYTVKAFLNGGATAAATLAGVTTQPAHFTGLADGLYTFTVTAQYGATNLGPVSANSGPLQIGGKKVTQEILVTKPNGTLDIAEACANGSGVVPAGTGPQFGFYPQDCNINLSAPVFNTTEWKSTGTIQPVSVQDLRDGDFGWHVSAQITDFQGAVPANAFNGNCLGFTPVATGLSNNPPVYTQTVTAGAAVLPNCAAPATTNLKSNPTALTGAIGAGLGRADLSGALDLRIPLSVKADNYKATMTFTVI